MSKIVLTESENKPHKGKIPQSRLVDLLKENLSCEMYHFLLNIFDTNYIVLKVFLTFCLLIGYFLASYTTIDLILTYLNYDVTSTTSTIYTTSKVFPKVTICNKNRYTTKYGYDFLQKQNLSITNGSRIITITTSLLQDMVMSSQIKSLPDAQKQKFNHNLEDMLLSCQFDTLPCSANDFVWEYDAWYGNCYTFNSKVNNSRKSFLPGPTYGLNLELYLNFYEDLAYHNSKNGGLGALVRIDNVTSFVDHLNDGILISTGVITSLVLKEELKYKLPEPYSTCNLDNDRPSFDSYLYNLIANSRYNYTQTFCLIQCFQQLVIEKCNCTVSAFANVMNASVCSVLDDYNCTWNVYTNIYTKNDYIDRVCIPQCPLECYSSKLTYTPSFSILLGNSLVEILKQNENISTDFLTRNITVNAVRESVAALSVYYDSLSYTISEESPQWTIISLIATIGGNLGLFLGVCMFSLFEIIVTLIEFYFYKRIHNKVRVKEPRQDESLE